MIRLIIILAIIGVLWWLGPYIRRAITQWALRRLQRRVRRDAEDYIRHAAGMPPREEESKSSYTRTTTQDTRESRRARERRHHRRSAWQGPLIPKEYAVDVEYVEIHDYSSATVIGEDSRGEKVQEWHESQVTDVEWVEIRDSGK